MSRASTLQRAAEGFRKGLLGKGSSKFMCRAVCMPLQGYLSVIGYETELVQGNVDLGDYDMEHTWLKLVDGQILDPTADQFDELGLPPVYIGPLPQAYSVNP